MPKKTKAEGEFVFIHFGDNAVTQHHARLVKPMAVNHPDDLDDDDSVEIYYTTSMTFARVKRRNIEYPKPDVVEGGSASLEGKRSAVKSSSSRHCTPRRSSRRKKRKSMTMSSPSSFSSLPSSDNGKKESSDDNKYEGSSSAPTFTNVTKQLHFDEYQGGKESKDIECSQRTKNKKPKLDNAFDGLKEQQSSISFFEKLVAPFVGLYNGVFGVTSSISMTTNTAESRMKTSDNRREG